MPVHRLDHINLRVSGAAFAALRDFYCRILGLRIGDRPPLESKGLWLYAGGAPIVHLVEASEGTGTSAATTGSGVALDHIAFECSDLEQILGRLATFDVPSAVRVNSVTGQIQLRLEDPSGLRIELLFPLGERRVLSAGASGG